MRVTKTAINLMKRVTKQNRPVSWFGGFPKRIAEQFDNNRFRQIVFLTDNALIKYGSLIHDIRHCLSVYVYAKGIILYSVIQSQVVEPSFI